MDADPEHEQFRALFSELREADGQVAPSFDRMWEAAHVRQMALPQNREFFARRAWLAAAALVLVAGIAAAVVIGVLKAGHDGGNGLAAVIHVVPTRVATTSSGRPTSAPDGVELSASIAEWQSPTAFLLDLSTDDEVSPFPLFRRNAQ